MNERDFIKKLEQRAIDQEKVIHKMLFPKIFGSVAFWLGNHPWRILIPIAFLITLIFRFTIGIRYDDFILNIFGKL